MWKPLFEQVGKGVLTEHQGDAVSSMALGSSLTHTGPCTPKLSTPHVKVGESKAVSPRVVARHQVGGVPGGSYYWGSFSRVQVGS